MFFVVPPHSPNSPSPLPPPSSLPPSSFFPLHLSSLIHLLPLSSWPTGLHICRSLRCHVRDDQGRVTVDVLNNQTVFVDLISPPPSPQHKVDSSGTPGRLDFIIKASSRDLEIYISTLCLGKGGGSNVAYVKAFEYFAHLLYNKIKVGFSSSTCRQNLRNHLSPST